MINKYFLVFLFIICILVFFLWKLVQRVIEFRMDWKDFLKYFTRIDFCHAVEKRKKFEFRFAWKTGDGHTLNRAGGSAHKLSFLENPQASYSQSAGFFVASEGPYRYTVKLRI